MQCICPSLERVRVAASVPCVLSGGYMGCCHTLCWGCLASTSRVHVVRAVGALCKCGSVCAHALPHSLAPWQRVASGGPAAAFQRRSSSGGPAAAVQRLLHYMHKHLCMRVRCGLRSCWLAHALNELWLEVAVCCCNNQQAVDHWQGGGARDRANRVEGTARM